MSRVTRHLCRARAAALVLIALISSASCGTNNDAKQPSIGSVPTPATDADLHLPIEQYMLSAQSRADLDWLRHTRIRACLRSFGLDYPVPRRAARGSLALELYRVTYRRYGITDPRSVQVWGYHLPEEAKSSGADGSAATGKVGQLSAAARRVLTGEDPARDTSVTSYRGHAVPAHGCAGETERWVSHDDARTGTGPDGIVTRIKQSSFVDSMADARVQKAFAQWSTCMNRRGYDLPDPPHAAEHMASMDASIPNASEIAQARADVACKSRTNLVGIWFATEGSYQKRAIDRHIKELRDVLTARDEESERINRLVTTASRTDQASQELTPTGHTHQVQPQLANQDA